jgi:hypothetical protein
MPTEDGSDDPLLGNFTADHNLIDHDFTHPSYSLPSALKRSAVFVERWVELVMVYCVIWSTYFAKEFFAFKIMCGFTVYK